MLRMTALALFSLSAMLPVSAFAADPHAMHADHGAMHANADQQGVQLVDGTVKKVDKAAGKVTIAHGPLLNLGMPAMTMAFRVRDAAWLDQLKVADKIRFLAEAVDGSLTVMQFERAN